MSDPSLLFSATNPQASVSATVTLGGAAVRVELSARAAALTEPELGEEITVIATLARRHALAAQHVIVAAHLAEHGHDRDATRDFLEEVLGLPAPDSVLTARTALFAARYPAPD